MPVWTGLMLNHRDLEDGMNKSSMRDFITPKQRKQLHAFHFDTAKLILLELSVVIVLVLLIGSL